MSWLSVVLAVFKLLGVATDILARRKLVSELEADVVRRYILQVDLDLKAIATARSNAAERDADPDKLRGDDGYKRD